MSGPSIHLRLPPLSLFKFPPDPVPYALPPPSDERTFKSPFPIDATLYNAVLDWRVPVTVASVYAVTVTIWNKLNRDRNHRPWAISKTRAFRALVILHNIALALFSALTFVAMMRALRHSWPGRYERHGFGIWWPTWRTENGLAGAADALCKPNGPRGLGDAAYFNSTSNLWEIKNKLIHLAENGNPDPTDVGRLWNEGVSFWGWFFYLSKFYEVLDTAIILLKGKRSSFLQTYHHAGAMFCMWAGIRYMSPPIWMFCWLNSGIHALMYTYYTLSALGIRVPQRVKRTLTTLQISQFFMGITFAAAHLFINYSVPVTTTYKFTTTVKSVVSAISSAASEAISEETAAITTAGVGNFLKKLAFRAAGEEGLAENVRDNHGRIFSHSQAPVLSREIERVIDTIREETRTRQEYHMVPCVDTSGQSFAIWLNLVYLLPLTGLFIRFFRRSYTRRTSTSAKHPTQHRAIAKSAMDAVHGVDRELEHVGTAVMDELVTVGNRIKKTVEGVDTRRISQTIEKFEHQLKDGADVTVQKAKELSEKTKKELEELRVNASPALDRARERAIELKNKGAKGAEAASRKADEVLAQSKEKAKPYVDEATEKAEEYARIGKEKAEELAKTTEEKAKAAGNAAKEQAHDAKEKVKQASGDARQKAEAVTDEAKDRVKEVRDEVQEKASEVKQETQDKAKKAKDKTNHVKDGAKDRSEQVKKEAEEKVETKKDEAKPKSNQANNRNASPQKRSISPHKRSSSPVKRSPSPIKRSPSPFKVPHTPTPKPGRNLGPPHELGTHAPPSGIQTSPSISGSYDNIGVHEAEGADSPGQPHGYDEDHSRHAPQGLSTTDPHEVHIPYSEIVKHPPQH